MIVFESVSKRYQGGRDALKQVSFHLAAGEIAFLTGHSGAGKSTLLKLITRIEQGSGGRAFVCGHELAKLKRRQIPMLRRSMGVIFQSPNLLDDRTVFDNVALPLVMAGTRHQDILKRVRAALDVVGLLSKERVYPAHLSGGEQQRIGIARAVVHRPNLLLADEPTGNLDPMLSADIMALFEKLNHFGVTVLIATHDLALVAKLRHRVLTLENGSLV